MSCRKGCATRDHPSYAACLRAASIRIAYCDSVNGRDATRQRNWDAELDAYAAARRQGIDPDGTELRHTRAALDWSDRQGQPYDARKKTEYLTENLESRCT